MKVFEYPYVIITIFIICFVLLAAVGIYFAIRGVKTANGHLENAFSSISKLEKAFKMTGKQRLDRCVMYIGVSSDKSRSTYSEPNVFTDIKQVMLSAFPDNANGGISVYGDNSYIAFSGCDADVARKRCESCLEEINKCLIKHGSINLVSVRVGAFFAFGSKFFILL